MKKSWLAWMTAVLVGGCADLRAPPAPPAVELPAQWRLAAAAPGSGPSAWWQNFADPQLDALLDQALQNNGDLAAAAVRVRRAQLQAGLVATNRSPSAALAASGGAGYSFDPAATAYASGLTATLGYEVDLWGKLAHQRDAAQWEAAATGADCQAVGLALATTAARLYWQLAYVKQSLTFNAADIAYAQQTLALARARHGAGAVSALGVAQAEQSLAAQEAQRTQVEQQGVETRHALALLLNQPPTATTVEPSQLPETALPPVAADLPAAVLAARPDLQAAELRLRATLTNIDVTRTSFYPTLALTGSLGTASTALLNLLRNPAATLGAGLTLPFIQHHTMALSIGVSQLQYEEALINYRQRLYTALGEVENSLSARAQLLAEEVALRQVASQAQRAEAIAAVRYQAGYTDLQQWLDAQLARRNAQRALLTNRARQLNSQATLYAALGTGAEVAAAACVKQ